MIFANSVHAIYANSAIYANNVIEANSVYAISDLCGANFLTNFSPNSHKLAMQVYPNLWVLFELCEFIAKIAYVWTQYL